MWNECQEFRALKIKSVQMRESLWQIGKQHPFIAFSLKQWIVPNKTEQNKLLWEEGKKMKWKCESAANCTNESVQTMGWQLSRLTLKTRCLANALIFNTRLVHTKKNIVFCVDNARPLALVHQSSTKYLTICNDELLKSSNQTTVHTKYQKERKSTQICKNHSLTFLFLVDFTLFYFFSSHFVFISVFPLNFKQINKHFVISSI